MSNASVKLKYKVTIFIKKMSESFSGITGGAAQATTGLEKFKQIERQKAADQQLEQYFLQILDNAYKLQHETKDLQQNLEKYRSTTRERITKEITGRPRLFSHNSKQCFQITKSDMQDAVFSYCNPNVVALLFDLHMRHKYATRQNPPARVKNIIDSMKLKTAKFHDLQLSLNKIGITKQETRDKYFFRANHDIKVALNYPISWMFEKKPEDLIDKLFFENQYLKTVKDECPPIGTKNEQMLKHQQIGTYVMRPFSPVQNVIFNSRTGSGKTRTMLHVLRQFYSFPCRKILLFKTSAIRKGFFEEFLKSDEKANLYSVEDREDVLKARFATNSSGLRYEVNNEFNQTYSRQNTEDVDVDARKCTFEKYVYYSAQKKSKGVTLALTFQQFTLMIQAAQKEENRFNADKIFGFKHFTDKEHELSFDGTAFFIDEAHALFEDKNKLILDIILQTKSRYYTALFTATPFANTADALKYSGLMGESKVPKTAGDMVKESEALKLLSRHMIFFNSLEAPLYNTETYQGVKVAAKSDVLKARNALFGEDIVKQKGYNNTWMMYGPVGSDIMTIYNLVLNRKTPPEKKYEKSFETLKQAVKTYGGEDIKKQQKATLENMQELSPYCWSLTQKLYDIYKENESIHRRAVIMVKMQYAKTISQWLKYYGKVPFVVFSGRTEYFPNTLGDGIEQFNNVDKVPGLTNYLKSIKDVNKPQKNRYTDQVVIDVFNKFHEYIPYMVYNFNEAEGVNIFDTTEMHAFIDDSSDEKTVTQAVGRINRMCRTTTKGKTIYFYSYDERPQDYYEKIVRKHDTWAKNSLYSS